MNYFRLKHWKTTVMVPAAANRISAVSGVYVITYTNWKHDLPVEMRILYVGKSTNLRRRFREHLDGRRTHRSDLLERLEGTKIYFWSLELEANEISENEKILIRELKPEYNLIRYGAENERQHTI